MKDAAADAAATADTGPAPNDNETRAEQNLRPQGEDLPRTPPSIHHHISESKRNFFNVYDFNSLSDDPAVKASDSSKLMM